jgi:glutamyl-tRNA synthetase
MFNWLYAKHTGGEFVLRIEDTDRQRSKQEYLDEILESIKWLGMDWDEIYYQSQRFDIYREYAGKLVEAGKAYEESGAIFFKYDFQSVEIDDLVRGKIVFTELPKKEEVIIKSDNSPTYNFSCCIDDALLNINCVIRGEDHISNTPKQALISQALGFKAPQFAHVPLILSPQGGRLSKRFGATSIREYREEGYLSGAIANYLLLMGWSPGNNREIISLAEAKDIFEIKNVNKTGAVFSLDKLNWVNSEYIRKMQKQELTDLVRDFLNNRGFLPADTERGYLEKVVGLFQGRIFKLADLVDWSRFCFYDDFVYAENTRDILSKDLSQEVKTLTGNLNAISDFNAESIEKEFRAVVETLGLKMRDLVHPTRIALTGEKIGPGLFETMEVLGKKRVRQRLNRLIDYWALRNTQG